MEDAQGGDKTLRVTKIQMDGTAHKFLASETAKYRKLISELEKENSALKKYVVFAEAEVEQLRKQVKTAARMKTMIVVDSGVGISGSSDHLGRDRHIYAYNANEFDDLRGRFASMSEQQQQLNKRVKKLSQDCVQLTSGLKALLATLKADIRKLQTCPGVSEREAWLLEALVKAREDNFHLTREIMDAAERENDTRVENQRLRSYLAHVQEPVVADDAVADDDDADATQLEDVFESSAQIRDDSHEQHGSRSESMLTQTKDEPGHTPNVVISLDDLMA